MSVRRHVALLNRSTVCSDEELEEICKALQFASDRHFAPVWGTGVIMNFVPHDRDTGWEDKWNLVVTDNLDEANALGYHDFTPEGLPVGKIGAKVDRLYGVQVSVTIAHELWEMLGDPEINRTAEDGRGRLCWYENADAVETDELGYDVGGVLISDFVFPTWFVPSLEGREGVQYDYCKHVSKPFELAPGGYQGYTETWPPNWQQEFAQGHGPDPAARLRLGSRRERRITPRRQWVRSIS